MTEKQALSKWKIRRNEEGKNNVEGGKRAEGHEIREVKGEGKASTSRPVADSTRRALAPGGTGSNREQVQLEGKRGNIAGISGRNVREVAGRGMEQQGGGETGIARNFFDNGSEGR